ncbi:TMV resistance protein N [Prunus persica]|uniref:TMV resistance protein N n=1 Tax=Prunus persica TaxID=3760 RepID=UPI0009AB493B|nr:TMV resistance protein N [Prunus persica]
MDAASTALEASSSSSPSNSSKQWKYDVFLSFRDEDTSKNFTDHPYCTLIDNRVNAYIDEKELPRGENISGELKQAIEQSRISVIVFSNRNQTGSFAEAFQRHESNFPEDKDKIERWRSALSEAANLAGGNLNNNNG